MPENEIDTVDKTPKLPGTEALPEHPVDVADQPTERESKSTDPVDSPVEETSSINVEVAQPDPAPVVEDVAEPEPDTKHEAVSEKAVERETETQPEPIAAESKSVDAKAFEPTPIQNDLKVSDDEDAEKRMRRISRRSFIWGAGAVAAAIAGWEWIITREQNNGVAWPLRRILKGNEKIARAVFKDKGLSPSFPKSWATEPVVTGDDGLSDDFDPASWSLNVVGGKKVDGKMADDGSVLLDLHDIKTLPKYDEVVEHHCVEGWSRVVHWSGARLADFVAMYGPAVMTDYVGLQTPDGGYYVGLEREAAMHPQTLLCYEMNGAPLGSDHGEPLRLAIPTKYGIKNIKRIGTITFTNTRPADFWAEQGYDWYAGL